MEQKDQPAPATALDDESGSGGEPKAEAAVQETNLSDSNGAKPPKKPNPVKLFLKKINLYLLLFVFVLIIAGAVTTVSYLNSRKAPPQPQIATEALTEEALKQLANSDATVGGSGQTLTVQGNAIFAGQVLAKKDLGVAGSIVTNSIRIGKDLTVPQLTVAANTNLNDVQANSLRVASNTAMQGSLTVQQSLSVAGSASFNGPVSIGQLAVNNLVMSGNATLQVPNHIAFTGAQVSRKSVNQQVLGSGGSASTSGSDTTGTVSINSGNNPTPGCFISITFNQKFTSLPHVIVSPVGQGAGQSQYYVNRDVNGFSICTANAAPAHQAFGFDYFVTQ